MIEFDEGNVNKFLIVGDVHIDAFGGVDYHHNLFEKFMFDVLPTYMFKYDVDKIIFMGDIFDSRKNVNTNSVKFITECIDHFLSTYREIDIYLITGNHDVYWKNTNKVTSLDYFNMCFNSDRIHIIKEPTEMYNMLLLPWITQDNREIIMESVEKSTMDYCLGHFEFGGFKQHKNDTFLSKGMSITEFKKFKKVISGHIHYSSESGNVLYTGCLFQMTKDDKNDSKKIFFLDTENDIIETIYHGLDIMVDLTITDDVVIPDCMGKKVYLKVGLGVSDKKVNEVEETIRLQQPLSINVYDNPNITKQDIDLKYTSEEFKTNLDIMQDYINAIADPNIDNTKLYDKMYDYYRQTNGG